MLKKEPQIPRPKKNYLRNPVFAFNVTHFFIMKVFFIFKKNMLPNISGI